MSKNITHSLVCPFLDDDPKFAYGCEFGMLYAQMQASADPVTGFFCRANQDQILLLASRSGWSVVEMKEQDEFWFWLHLERTVPT